MSTSYIVSFEQVLALKPEHEGKYIAKVYAFEDEDKYPNLPLKRRQIALVGESCPDAAQQFINWLAAGAPDAATAKAGIASLREEK